MFRRCMSEDNKSEDNKPTRYNPKKNSKSEMKS